MSTDTQLQNEFDEFVRTARLILARPKPDVALDRFRAVVGQGTRLLLGSITGRIGHIAGTP